MSVVKYYTEEQIKKFIENQKINLWVNSYGGSGSNWLRENLMHKYVSKTLIWKDKLCHYIRPINNIPIKFAVYIYGNPLYASVSELKRYSKKKNMSFFELNFYKMMPIEYKNLKYNYQLMMEKMIEQMNNWKNANVNYPIILIKYEKIYENVDKIEKTLDFKFKIPFKKRKTDQKIIDTYTKKYNLNNHNEIINKTINVYNNMPDFQIIYPKK